MNSMQKILEQLENETDKAKKAPMLKKAIHIERASVIMNVLLNEIVELLTLTVESYNGLAVYIDQCSNNPSQISDINERLKKANKKLLGVNNNGE